MKIHKLYLIGALVLSSFNISLLQAVIPITNATGDSFTVLLDYSSKDYYPVTEIDKDTTFQVDPDIKTIIIFPKGLEGAAKGTQWPKSKNFPPTNQASRFFLFKILGSGKDINAYAGNYPKIEDEINRGLKSLRIIKIDTANPTYVAYGLWKVS